MDKEIPGEPDASESRPIDGPVRLRPRLGAPAVIIAGAALWLSAPGSRPRPPATRLGLDANTAPVEALAALPGLGPARIAAIESARASAPFRSLEDFERRVKGIGPATAAELAPHLRFGPEPPHGR